MRDIIYRWLSTTFLSILFSVYLWFIITYFGENNSFFNFIWNNNYIVQFYGLVILVILSSTIVTVGLFVLLIYIWSDYLGD